MAVLTTSYGPTDTPPDTMSASAPAVEAATEPAEHVVEVVGRDPEVDGLAARRGHQGPQARGRSRRGSRPDRAAGPARGPRRRSPARRPAAGGGPGSVSTPAPAIERDGGRGDRPTRLEQDGAGDSRSLPGGAHGAAGRAPPRGRGPRPDEGRVASRPRGPEPSGRVERCGRLDRDDRVGTVGEPGAGRDPGGGARADRHGRRSPGRDVADDAEADRRGLGRRTPCRRRRSHSRPSPSSARAAARPARSRSRPTTRPSASAAADGLGADGLGDGEDGVARRLDAQQPGRRDAHEPGSGPAIGVSPATNARPRRPRGPPPGDECDDDRRRR